MTDHDPLGIAGEVIAEKYRVEHLVGEGGFAVVYRAKHQIWDKPVAIKFFNGLSRAPSEYRDTLQQQFVHEGALLTELSVQTSGIVQARDVGFYTTPDGQWVPYIVLEWLDGSPLEAILEQDQRQGLPWTESEVIGFLKRILAPLEVAHRSGVTHRDIKPANIFVLGSAARSPETPCKLLDFGVAKMVSDHSTLKAALARTGLAATSFTPQYGAPEQFTRSYGATGPWTDVYAVALVASEMLVGRAALEGEDLIQLGFSSGNPDKRPTPRALGARISERLEAVFAKALAVHPEDRYADAGEFLRSTLATAGDIAAHGTSEALSPPPLPPPPPMRSSTNADGLPRAEPVSRSPRTEGAAATTVEPASNAPSGESGLGIMLVVLLAIASGTLVFSATGLPGAQKTRHVLAAMAQDIKRLANSLWSERSTPSALPASSTPMLERAAIAGTSECPPHTWRLALATETPPRDGPAPPADGGAATLVRCIDEAEVSELAYAACSTCDKPKTIGAKARTNPQQLSVYCLTGREPTPDAIRCVTWKQAKAFCQVREAALPTLDELMAIGRSGTSKGASAPSEWSSAPPKGGPATIKQFRCVVRK